MATDSTSSLNQRLDALTTRVQNLEELVARRLADFANELIALRAKLADSPKSTPQLTPPPPSARERYHKRRTSPL